MMVLIRICALYLMCISLFCCGSGTTSQPSKPQIPKSEKSVPNSKQVTARPQSQPFDPTALKLPPRFAGHDERVLVQELLKRFPPKTEFETNAAYEKRISDTAQKPFWSGKSLTDWIFAVSCVLPELKYDAEHEVFESKMLGLTRAPHGSSHDPNTLWFSTYQKTTGTYSGQSALGVKKEITNIQRETYSLVDPAITHFKFYQKRTGTSLTARLDMPFHFSVPVPVSVAPEAKSQLRMLLVFKAVDPFVEMEINRVEPSINYPSDIHNQMYYISSKLLKVLIYNFDSGSVYQHYE